jgi:hypothetical protein
MLIPDRYQDNIYGVISCYDRVIIQGTLPNWCYDRGMTGFCYGHGIRIFDYPQFAKGLRDQVRQNTEEIARENNVKIELFVKLKASVKTTV